MRQKVNSIDIIRIVLIFVVFLCHTSSMLPEQIGFFFQALTGYALEMFFIISGLLSAVNYYCYDIIKTNEFVKHKLTKIYPLHFVMYLACFLLELFLNQKSIIKLLIYSIPNLLLIQSWIPNLEYIYSFNGVTWFLSSLFFCWIITPNVIRYIQNKKNKTIKWDLFALIIFRGIYIIVFRKYIGFDTFYFVNIMPLYRMMEYLIGINLGILYLHKKEHITSDIIQVSSVLSLIIIFSLDLNSRYFEPFFIVFELFCIYSLCFIDGIITRVAKSGIIKYCSSISFSFFIIHQVVIKYIEFVLKFFNITIFKINAIKWLTILIITLVLCEIYRKISNRYLSVYLPKNKNVQ